MNEFKTDLSVLIKKITANKPECPDSKLGDVIQYMGQKGFLFKRLKDDEFGINETIDLCEQSRFYLNVLQTEKLFHCKMCYLENDLFRCEFHKKYIFNLDPVKNREEYIKFLNTDMGIISFIELYYSYLSTSPIWTAQMILRDLCGFSSIKELLQYYNYECNESVDKVDFEIMDCN
jgi:Protein of unknown function (DUF1247)